MTADIMEQVKAIARVRACTTNRDVLDICDGYSRLLAECAALRQDVLDWPLDKASQRAAQAAARDNFTPVSLHPHPSADGKFDKRAYQRGLMRKRRAEKKEASK